MAKLCVVNYPKNNDLFNTRLGSLSDLGSEQYPNCPMKQADAMSTHCPRVLKTHLSIDMLPDQIMRKENKVVNMKIWTTNIFYIGKLSKHSRSFM